MRITGMSLRTSVGKKSFKILKQFTIEKVAKYWMGIRALRTHSTIDKYNINWINQKLKGTQEKGWPHDK